MEVGVKFQAGTNLNDWFKAKKNTPGQTSSRSRVKDTLVMVDCQEDDTSNTGL